MSSSFSMELSNGMRLIRNSGSQTDSQRVHRRCRTLKTRKPQLVLDALASRELPLDALLSFPINWDSYLESSYGIQNTGKPRGRPNPNPLQRITQKSNTSPTSASSSSGSNFTRAYSARDDSPPKLKKQFLAPLPSPLVGCGHGQILGTSENTLDTLDEEIDQSSLGLINLDLLEESDQSPSGPLTPALTQCDSPVSTPRSASPAPLLSTPKVSFRPVDYNVHLQDTLVKMNEPLISPLSEEPPQKMIPAGEGTGWREWEGFCLSIASTS